jgi:hypothetical protein
MYFANFTGSIGRGVMPCASHHHDLCACLREGSMDGVELGVIKRVEAETCRSTRALQMRCKGVEIPFMPSLRVSVNCRWLIGNHGYCVLDLRSERQVS